MATPKKRRLAVHHVVRWFFDEGLCNLGTLPFYCGPDRVGAFAVALHLRRGER